MRGIVRTVSPVAVAAALLLFPGVSRPQGAPAHEGHEGLHPLPPGEAARLYRFALASEPETPVAGKEALLVLSASRADGSPVSDLQRNHERLLHVLVVGRNLEDFQHLHPEDQGTLTAESVGRGRYPVKVTFAQGGTYRVTADLAHGGHTVAVSFAVEVAGPPQRRTRWNWSAKRDSGDLEVAMKSSNHSIQPREPVTLTFTVRSDGAPVTDLEPWLGAPAHLALYSEQAASAEHLHGEIPGAAGHASHADRMGHGSPSGSAEDFFAGESPPALFGPSVAVGHVFPREGRYRIFLQFQRRGTVHTVPFDLEVEEEARGD